MKPNRIVALVTPVAALAAGACATWLAQHFPGIDINQGQLQSIFIAGAVVALAPAAQWLHGWQKYEAREGDAANAIKLGTIGAAPVPAAAAAAPDDSSGIDDLADLDGLDSLDDVDDLDELDDELLADDDELVGTAD
jgi:hypothetical protein